MPRYKRTEFDEEETSSMASMAVDVPMVTSPQNSRVDGTQVNIPKFNIAKHPILKEATYVLPSFKFLEMLSVFFSDHSS